MIRDYFQYVGLPVERIIPSSSLIKPAQLLASIPSLLALMAKPNSAIITAKLCIICTGMVPAFQIVPSMQERVAGITIVMLVNLDTIDMTMNYVHLTATLVLLNLSKTAHNSVIRLAVKVITYT